MSFKDKFIDFQTLSVNDDLILRQVNPENDLQSYYEIYAHPDVFNYYSGNQSTDDNERVKKILYNQINAFEKMREYIWTIADKKTDKALGRIHLSDFQLDNKAANIGYFIRKDCWGKGIASACIKP